MGQLVRSLHILMMILYLEIIDGYSVSHDRDGIIDAAPLVEDVCEVDERHVTVLVRGEVERATDALQRVVVVADDAPVQPGQVVQDTGRLHALRRNRVLR